MFGENGTGKSTVADIVEFYFTGGIDFLRKEGRGHATRHIGASKHRSTFVEVETSGKTGGRRDYPTGKSIESFGGAPTETFLLRGRTLSDFVNKSKGEKWTELSEILGLEAVDALRLNLQTAANQLGRTAEAAAQELQSARDALGVHGVDGRADEIISAIQGLCKRAAIEPPKDLAEAVSTSWGNRLSPGKAGTLEVELSTLVTEVSVLPAYSAPQESLARWNESVRPSASGDEVRLRLMRAGKDLLDRGERFEVCPLCGQDVQDSDIREHVAAALESLRAAADELTAVEAHARALLDSITTTSSQRQQLIARARDAGVELPTLPSSPAVDVETGIRKRIAIDAASLDTYARSLDAWKQSAAATLDGVAPSPGIEEENPLFKLVLILQLAKRWSDCETTTTDSKRSAEVALKVFTAYQGAQRKYFDHVLSRISGRAAEIYARLHPGEGFGSILVEPMSDKGVELMVEFHGSRQKPPHGVLSESHLNSLAIALFLAMAETFNERLGFLVLDDVVNSFDIGHRAQLAELLATEFADWQLLVLTHDEQFYRRIRRMAPAWSSIEFSSWTYEEGPRTTLYETGDMLAAAQQSFDGHDRTGAATKGRRAVEEFLQEVCEGIAAPLPFRRGSDNDRREIGELMKGLRSRMRERDKVGYNSLVEVLNGIDADVQAALNVEAHSSVGHASEAEVAMALERLRGFIAYWTCPHCRTRRWKQGGPDVFVCRCGRTGYPAVAK